MKEKWQPKVAAFSAHPVEYLRRERKRDRAWRCRKEWGRNGMAGKGDGWREGERGKEEKKQGVKKRRRGRERRGKNKKGRRGKEGVPWI